MGCEHVAAGIRETGGAPGGRARRGRRRAGGGTPEGDGTIHGLNPRLQVEAHLDPPTLEEVAEKLLDDKEFAHR